MKDIDLLNELIKSRKVELRGMHWYVDMIECCGSNDCITIDLRRGADTSLMRGSELLITSEDRMHLNLDTLMKLMDNFAMDRLFNRIRALEHELEETKIKLSEYEENLQ